MSSFKFLPALKRQPAVRNRGNPSMKTSVASSKGRPSLPALPELSEEEDIFSSSSTTSFYRESSPSPARSMAGPRTTANKRMSRYGKSEFAIDQSIILDDDFLMDAPRPAPRPPCAPSKAPPAIQTPPRTSVRLSAFDIRFDFDTSESSYDAEPTPTTTTSSPCRISPSSPRALSPSPSVSSNFTSTSGSSSGGMPTTPTSSDEDDEWEMFPRPSKVPQCVTIRPLVIIKTAPAYPRSDASPVEVFEFTIAPAPSPSPSHDANEDDAAWYSREMSDMVTLFSDTAPIAPARRDSLPLPARSSASGTRSRFSKPLPTVPRSPGPSAQLDPMFPRRKRIPPPIPSRPPPPPPRRKSLTITVPRPPPRMSLPADVADILDDIDAWALGPNEHSATIPPLSPPRLPESPYSAADDIFDQYTYTPIDIEIDRQDGVPALPNISLPDSPIILSSAPETPLAQMYEMRAQDFDGDAESGFEPMLRSRWSSSTLASEYAVPASASSRLKFHLGDIARRVRSRRESKGAAAPDALSKENLERKMKPRMSMESVESRSDSGDSSSSSGLRRKPIPLEIFLRS